MDPVDTTTAQVEPTTTRVRAGLYVHVRRFSFATPKAQRAFLRRTHRCVTFFTT